MSRVGEKPVPLPAGVNVTLEAEKLMAKGPMGELTLDLHPAVTCEMKDGNVVVGVSGESKQHRSLHGLFRSLINNVVVGVSEGYQRRLEIVGVGYRADVANGRLKLQLGFSHPIVFVPPEGISIEASSATSILIKGIDKQLVGQVAAKIRSFKPPEPYKGKGIRYEGEYVRKKAGKAAA